MEISTFTNSIDMIRYLIAGIILGTLTSSAYTQQIFLQVDTQCMNRLEYRSSSSPTTYLSYATLLQGGHLLVMDLKTTAPKTLRTKPTELYMCTNFNATPDLVRSINKGQAHLSIVIEDGTGLKILDVDKVTLFQTDGKKVWVFSQDANFSFHPDSLVAGVNLADSDSKLQVFLEGIIQIQCAKGYIFRKKVNPRAAEYKEWVFLPEIGIIEKSAGELGNFGAEQRKNTLSLTKIDDISYHDFLTGYCDRLQASMYDRTQPFLTDPKEAKKESGGPSASSKTAQQDPCTAPAAEGVHVVQKGETLYGIARRYGIQLEDLRRWNNLTNTNVISVCQHLYVKDPATLANAGRLVVTNPQPKGTDTGRESTFSTNEKFHVVKPGETVAMIAQLYGYTEERFRKMNGLAANEQVVPGQQLRTTDCVCPPTGQPTEANAANANQADKSTEEVRAFYKPIKVHVVKESDTLYSIAKQYNTTPERILELNGLKKGDKIKPNQRLYVQ